MSRAFLERWPWSPLVFLGLITALLAACIVTSALYEHAHPCVRWDVHWDDSHVIGYTGNGDAVYGAGEVRTCVERAP